MDNTQKISRLRNGKNRSGNYYFSFALDKARTKFIALTFGKPDAHFLSFIVRANANGIALGTALVFFQFSLSFTDDNYPDQPELEYGFFIKDVIAIYCPNRYLLWKKK